MAQQFLGWRHPVWSWFAKGWLIVGLPTAVLFAVFSMQKKAEADAYAQAPVCAPAVTDSSSCRLLTDAEITEVHCPPDFLPPNGRNACDLQLQVGDLRRFLSFPLGLGRTLSPGARLRVELFRGLPTGAQFGDRFVPRSVPPQEAAQMLMASMVLTLTLALIAAVYLWKRRKWSKA